MPKTPTPKKAVRAPKGVKGTDALRREIVAISTNPKLTETQKVEKRQAAFAKARAAAE